MRSLSEFFRQRGILLAAISAVAGIILVFFATAKPIQILVDDQLEVVHTHARVVGSVIKTAGIELHEGDRVFPELSSSLDESGIIEIQRSFSVELNLDGMVKQVRSIENTAADILAVEGITLLPGDRIWIDGIPESNPGRILSDHPMVIDFRSGVEISVNVDGQERTIRTAAATVGEGLSESGIEVFEGDLLQPALEESLFGVEEILLRHAEEITVHYGESSLDTFVVADNVGQALQRAGLPLIGLDYAIPSESEAIPENGIIRIIRVTEELIIEQIPIPFETVYVANPNLEIDNQVVMETGAYGVLANQIRLRYEDGEEISRNLEGEWVAREPLPRQVGYGTNIVIRSLSTPNGPVEYWRAMRMWATSYSPSRAGVPDDYEWFGITACGKKLVKGLVAIDNRYIPFYTQMYVPDYGFAEACDTGGGVKGRWIDLGYEDHNYKSWHQYVTVYFLTPVPPANTIAWIFP